jgi:predicted acylesterase/phospholipase RssA
MPEQTQRYECDLIMKGGITSGVAYPAAVQELHKKYDFVNIGGASAGAIAAAVTAAAQFQPGGFERLDTLRAEMAKPGLLLQLFQTTKETRPLLHLLLAVQQQRTSLGKAAVCVSRVAARLALPAALWTAGGFAVFAFLLGHAGATWSSLHWPAIVVLAVLLAVVSLIALMGCVVFRLWRAVNTYLPTSNFGMVLGMSEDGKGKPALTEWLHTQIQNVAGRPADEPLTFAELAAQGVQLRMMTTDLTWTRPVRFPEREQVYYYSAEEFEGLFPGPILRHLAAKSGPEEKVDTPYGPRTLRPLPTGDLPVLVATRMSLALPVLLSSIPLWTRPDQDPPVRHWISDGGISSNFPMHFFDAWVPSRPTFGLDLNYTGAEKQHRQVGDYVQMYPAAPPAPGAAKITSVTGLLGQVLSTMEDWRDTMQAELDGFHDRIAHIDLAPEEGGMNLAMSADTIAWIGQKGACAGERLRDEFDWDAHRLRRYKTFMGMLQDGLVPPPLPIPSDSPHVLSAWESGLQAQLEECAAAPPPGGPSAEWYRAAAKATSALLTMADEWLGPADGVPASNLSFRPDPPPSPPARMRVTPDV